MTNLEAAAEAYARNEQRKYVTKRGGQAPVNAAFNVYVWAYNLFITDPEATERRAARFAS